MKNILISSVLKVALFFGIASCGSGHSDSAYFFGEIVDVTIPPKIDSLEGRELFLDNFLTGSPLVYDSILITSSTQYPDYCVLMYNINDSSHMGSFFPQGRGPEECMGVGYYDRFYVEGSELKLLIHAYNENKVINWNVSRSIRDGKTVADTVHDLKRHKLIPMMCYGYVFRIDNNLVLARVNPELLSLHSLDYSLPMYFTIHLNSGEVTDSLQLFKKILLNKKCDNFNQRIFLSTTDRMHPDGKKMVSAMFMLGQIGITDLESHQTKWFRVSGTPRMAYLRGDFSSLRVFYDIVCVDSENIYALWQDKPFGNLIENGGRGFHSNIVHVFDWEGNFVKVLHLSERVHDIIFDPVRKILYGKDNDYERLWSFDLKHIKK